MSKDKTGGAAPAKGKDAAATDKPAEGATESAPKTRNRLSGEKALAIQIAGLVAILSVPAIAALLTDPQKAQVQGAQAAAKELNDKTIQPIKDRIEAIGKEFTELAPKFREPGVAAKVKELSSELAKLETKLSALTSAAA